MYYLTSARSPFSKDSSTYSSTLYVFARLGSLETKERSCSIFIK